MSSEHIEAAIEALNEANERLEDGDPQRALASTLNAVNAVIGAIQLIELRS